jgi:hypothetical protein
MIHTESLIEKAYEELTDWLIENYNDVFQEYLNMGEKK